MVLLGKNKSKYAALLGTGGDEVESEGESEEQEDKGDLVEEEDMEITFTPSLGEKVLKNKKLKELEKTESAFEVPLSPD